MSRLPYLGLVTLTTVAAVLLWWLTFIELPGLGPVVRGSGPAVTPDGSVHGQLWRAIYQDQPDAGSAAFEATVAADSSSPLAHAARLAHALGSASGDDREAHLARLTAIADPRLARQPTPHDARSRPGPCHG